MTEEKSGGTVDTVFDDEADAANLRIAAAILRHRYPHGSYGRLADDLTEIAAEAENALQTRDLLAFVGAPLFDQSAGPRNHPR